MSATVVVVGYDPLIAKAYQHTGLGQPLADYLASKTRAGLAAKTLEHKERLIAALALMFPDKTVDQITSFDVMHWEAQQHVQPQTLKVNRSHLHDFFHWCVLWDLIVKNPYDRIEPVRVPGQKVYDTFEDAEVEALLALPIVDGALLAIMFRAGLRRSECANLQVRHIIPPGDQDTYGHIRVLGGKGNKDRLVGMGQRLSRAVAELQLVEGLEPADHFWYVKMNRGRVVRRTRPMGDGSFARWWRNCLDAAGVRYRNPHMARHTFATRWLRRGGRLETLSASMGHKSIKTTYDLYAHLDMRDVFADLAVIEDQ